MTARSSSATPNAAATAKLMATPTLPKTQSTLMVLVGPPWLAHDTRTIKNPNIFYSGKYMCTYLFSFLLLIYPL